MSNNLSNNGQQPDPEHSARKAVERALLRTSILPAAGLLVGLAVAVAALSLTVVAAASSLNLLHGWKWWFAAVYLLAVVGAGAAWLCSHRTKVLGKPHAGRTVTSWKQTRSELVERDAWLVRLGTAPLAPLAVVRFAVYMPTSLAMMLAIVGWLSLDVLTVVTVPARRRLMLALRLINPRHPDLS